jgi:type II secretory pathway pseudopilin PulG
MWQNGSGEDGFSLIEAVIAIGLFSLSILAAAQMAGTVINTHQTARDVTAALFLAQNKMEELKAREFSNVVDGEEKKLDAGGACGEGRFDRWVEVSDWPKPLCKSVVVRVGWGCNNSRQVVLTTIIAP